MRKEKSLFLNKIGESKNRRKKLASCHPGQASREEGAEFDSTVCFK